MSKKSKPEIGSVTWFDLTTLDAESVRDFYSGVAGWKPEPVDMGGYSDFNMTAPESGQPITGICHARGSNADLPPQWLIYITVADVDASAARCRELGGAVVSGPKDMGEEARYCVIRDPAGAVAALISFKNKK